MPRFTQTWTCRACGHYVSKTVTYPKYGASETPLTEIAKRSRCTSCGLRGTAQISEEPATEKKRRGMPS